MKRDRLLSGVVIAGMSLAIVFERGVLLSQAGGGSAIDVDNTIRTVRVRFGVNDKDPAKWDGTAAVTGGTILRIRNWHPRAGDIVENNSWSLATRRGPLFV